MKNHKIKIFLVIPLLCLCIGCKRDTKEESYVLLNDVFLQAIDTMGYYGNILLPPVYNNEKVSMRDSQFVKHPYLILVNKPLDTIYVWGKTIEKMLLDNGYSLKEITRLKMPNDYKWDVSELKERGRYLIIDSINPNTFITKVGHIWFSKIIFHPSGNKAFFLLERETGMSKKKGSIISMIWLEKSNGVWKIIREDPFYFS